MKRKRTTVTVRYVPERDWYQVTFWLWSVNRKQPCPSRNYGSLQTLLDALRDHFGKEK